MKTSQTFAATAARPRAQDSAAQSLATDPALLRMRKFNAELDSLMRLLFYSGLSLEEFLVEASHACARTLGVGRVSVWCFDEERTEIRCACLHNGRIDPQGFGLVLKREDHQKYFEAISQSRLIIADDVMTDPRLVEFHENYFSPLNIMSLLDAQIPSASGVRGVVCCEAVGEPRSWAVDEVSFAAQLAQLVGLAFERDDRLQSQRELLDALTAAERAGEAKTSFLANMSHEIRTPMNGIIGMLDLALSNEEDAAKRDTLQTASHAADSLMRLLDDILDYSRLEAGKFEILARPFDFERTLKDVVQLFQPRADAKGLQVSLDYDEKLPSSILGDGVRVRQILSNFMSNAVKFTASGSVGIKVIANPGTRHAVRVEVRDTGPGLSQENMDRLFKRFSRADTVAAQQESGSGLGLAICKQLSELMGGTIGVESQLGEGSCFWVELPLIAAEPITHETLLDQTVDGESETPLRILCADDNLVNRKVLEGVLGKLGHHVTLVEDGLEALEAIKTAPFDVVLMDIQMPNLDGSEATRIIRSGSVGQAQIPIIALTANAMEGNEEEYLNAGMDKYLPKPVKIDALKKALSEYSA